MKKLVLVIVACLISLVSLAKEDYMVELEFYQSSFTLSITQHIKDSCNKFSFTFPTTKEFYDSVQIGQELSSNFKTATFFLSGNIGSRKIRVKNKFIKKTEDKKTSKLQP